VRVSCSQACRYTLAGRARTGRRTAAVPRHRGALAAAGSRVVTLALSRSARRRLGAGPRHYTISVKATGITGDKHSKTLRS
jgi:hypothetical protein